MIFVGMSPTALISMRDANIEECKWWPTQRKGTTRNKMSLVKHVPNKEKLCLDIKIGN